MLESLGLNVIIDSMDVGIGLFLEPLLVTLIVPHQEPIHIAQLNEGLIFGQVQFDQIDAVLFYDRELKLG